MKLLNHFKPLLGFITTLLLLTTCLADDRDHPEIDMISPTNGVWPHMDGLPILHQVWNSWERNNHGPSPADILLHFDNTTGELPPLEMPQGQPLDNNDISTRNTTHDILIHPDPSKTRFAYYPNNCRYSHSAGLYFIYMMSFDNVPRGGQIIPASTTKGDKVDFHTKDLCHSLGEQVFGHGGCGPTDFMCGFTDGTDTIELWFRTTVFCSHRKMQRMVHRALQEVADVKCWRKCFPLPFLFFFFSVFPFGPSVFFFSPFLYIILNHFLVCISSSEKFAILTFFSIPRRRH
jgi:hypothetical protein